jgi:hypothetical protein
LFQDNVQEPNAIHSSLLPIVRPGTAHVTRDVISQLMKMLCGGEQIVTEAQTASSSWTCPRTTPQLDITQCQRRLSLEAHFPIDTVTKTSQPQSVPTFSDGLQMDFEDNVSAMRGSNEARTVI